MNISIMSRRDAKKYSYRLPFKTAIISITDPDSVDNSFGKSENLVAVLKLKFEDVCSGYPGCMTEEDARKIVDFVNSVEDKIDLLVVHCEAGISRSAGVAAAISRFKHGDDSWVFDSGKYIPNMHCYKLVLQEFHKNT